MIKYLLARNWRGYEKLALELEPGLTFVVAENGTGKTSLLQAASWALFGEAAGLELSDMLRLEESGLSVQLALDIAGTDVNISRGWSEAGRPREAIVAEVDSASATESGVSDRLTEAAGVSAGVLNRLWFVPEMRLVEEANLFADIQEHLRHLLGIDSLDTIAGRAKRVAASAGKKAGNLKQAQRLNQNERSQAEQQATELLTKVAEIDAAVADLKTERGQVSTELATAAAWERYESDRSAFSEAQAALARRAEALDATPNPEAAADQLRTAQALVDHELAAVDAEQGVIASLRVQLESADASCPVCLQPISDEQGSRALETHQHRVDALVLQRLELEGRLRELEARSHQINTLASEMSHLRHPEPPATSSGRPSTEVRVELDSLDNKLEQRNREHGELAGELRRIQAALQADELSATAARQTSGWYATEALARVLSESAKATAADRVERALMPLTEAISAQWQAFFPGKGSPALSGEGEMVLRKGASQLKHTQFSGGERVLASLVTRLLFTASSTGLRSIWLDEPLEHLDPVNRVKAARLMVQATQPGNRLQQIVVTTYEEGLARTLASRHDHVRIRYVSTDELF